MKGVKAGSDRTLIGCLLFFLLLLFHGLHHAASLQLPHRAMLLAESAAGPIFSLEQNEREQIAEALRASAGNRAHAAEMLGISRATIFRKIKTYGLS